jgi:DNA-binding NarL/FixJ family response regulator
MSGDTGGAVPTLRRRVVYPLPGSCRRQRDESTKDCLNSDIISPAPSQISAAQNRVFQKLLKGLSDKEIAHELKISPKTVHQHVQAIFRTMGVHSRPELLASFITVEMKDKG